MSYENATILFRHGRDDFAVWEMDLPEHLIRQARRSLNTAAGDLAFIDQRPTRSSIVLQPGRISRWLVQLNCVTSGDIISFPWYVS